MQEDTMAESTPASASSRASLSTELHDATRGQHHELNKRIIARLPFSIPPNTDGPLLYTKGMTVFGQIYFAFEEEWQAGLSQHIDMTDEIRIRHHEILSMFPIRSLLRTQRLQSDLLELKHRLGPIAASKINDLEELSQKFAIKIQTTVQTRSYLLLAYAWTMYLALFNGGRWIRKQLIEAGDEFWIPPKNQTSHSSTNDQKIIKKEKETNEVLSFWSFDGSEDGEDIKRAFKQRFSDASLLLTDQEKDEIISETKSLFSMCMEMIQLLDENSNQSQISKSSSIKYLPILAYSNLSSLLFGVWKYILFTCGSWTKLRMFMTGKSGNKDIHVE